MCMREGPNPEQLPLPPPAGSARRPNMAKGGDAGMDVIKVARAAGVGYIDEPIGLSASTKRAPSLEKGGSRETPLGGATDDGDDGIGIDWRSSSAGRGRRSAAMRVREHNMLPGTLDELFRLLDDDAELRDTQVDWSRLRLLKKLGAGQYGDVCQMELSPATQIDAGKDGAGKGADVSIGGDSMTDSTYSEGSTSSGSAYLRLSLSSRVAPARPGTQCVAVKRLLPAPTLSDVNDFRREIKMLHSLQHDNVVSFVGWGKYGSSLDKRSGGGGDAREALFLAEELCTGGSLRDLVSAENRGAGWKYGGKEALRWLLDIARALEYLHGDHDGLVIMHRDLKLANILLEHKYVPGTEDLPMAKLCDFGVARPVANANAGRDAPTGGETAAAVAAVSTEQMLEPPAKKEGRAKAKTRPATQSEMAEHRRQIANQMTSLTGSVPYMAPYVRAAGTPTTRSCCCSAACGAHRLTDARAITTRNSVALCCVPNRLVR